MSSEDNFIGKSLGNYHITGEIGSGGFGNVYLGQHTILTERSVAVKRIHSHLGSQEERERFLEEARLLERLKHPHILHIFDVGIFEGFPYLVAEYAPNGSLRDRLKQYAPNPPPLQEALNILSQVGQGLYYAHQRNVIHRDLKPANILFNAQGEALLADFGIATTLSTSSITHAAIIGTPPYMAPEQFQGSVSKESDQYALGCIAYELFTGKLPFNATDFFAMGFEHLTKQPVAPTQLNPHLPIHIERAILKALAKQRHDRHADVKAFIMALYTPGNQQYLISTIPDTYPVSSPMTPIPLTDHSQAPTINHNLPFSAPVNISQVTVGQHLPENTRHSAGEDARIAQKTPPLYKHTPTTPVPPIDPSFLKAAEATGVQVQQDQRTETPSPSTAWEETPLYSRAPVTPFPPLAELTTDAASTMLLPNNMPTAPAQAEKKPGSRRKWLLIAAVALFIIIANTGLFYFLFVRNPSQSIVYILSTQKTITTTQGVTSTSGHQIGTREPKHGTQPINSTINNSANPTATNSLTATATSRPNATATPSPTSTSPVTETLTVYFINGTNGVQTTHSYHGTVSISSSGYGSEYKKKMDDTFYQYTDQYGNPMTPPLHTSTYPGWTLWINGSVADNSIQIPQYNSNHDYSFTMNASGYLTFAIGDTYPSDNSGSLTITITQK